jgi:hypothetical protein
MMSQSCARISTQLCFDKVTAPAAIITSSQNMMCSLASLRLRMRLAMAEMA